MKNFISCKVTCAQDDTESIQGENERQLGKTQNSSLTGGNLVSHLGWSPLPEIQKIYHSQI